MKSPNSSPKLQATTTRTARPPGTLGIAGTCALLLATYPTQTYAASPPHSPAKPGPPPPPQARRRRPRPHPRRRDRRRSRDCGQPNRPTSAAGRSRR